MFGVPNSYKAWKWQVKVFVEEMIQGGGVCQNFGHVMYGG